MTPFSNTRSKRRTIFAVLLAWLFALGSGWANACLLQERSTHWHQAADDAAPTALSLRVSPGHVGLDSEHAENAGSARSVCLKVCSDDTRTILKLTSSVDLTDAAMAPPSALTWDDPLDATAQAVAGRESAAPGAGVPLRTLFSRLAL